MVCNFQRGITFTVRSTVRAIWPQSVGPPLEVGQRALIIVVVLNQFTYNSCPAPRILAQDSRLGPGRVGCDLGPVQPEELLRDLGRGQIHFRSTVVSLEEAQVRDGMKQGELVAGHKVAFFKEPLDRPKKRELLFGGWWPCGAHGSQFTRGHGMA